MRPKTYEQSLDDVAPVNPHELSEITDNIHRDYENFLPKVAALSNNLPKRVQDSPSWIATGNEAHVFMLDQEHVLKVLRNEHKASIGRKTVTAALASGVPNLEQVVATSVERGHIISRYAPGEGMLTLSKQKADQITDEHLSLLIQAAQKCEELELNFDPAPQNLMFDSNAGFTFIDIGRSSEYDTYRPLEAVAYMLNPLSPRYFIKKSDPGQLDSTYTEQLLKRLATVGKQELSDDELKMQLNRGVTKNIQNNRHEVTRREAARNAVLRYTKNLLRRQPVLADY